MRTSIASAAFLLVGAGAATLAAVDTTGSNIALNGSDTLFDVTRSVITSCATQFSDFASQNITYLGGGSGVGAGQMDTNAQQVSPMSRALKNSEYCSTRPPLPPAWPRTCCWASTASPSSPTRPPAARPAPAWPTASGRQPRSP